MERYAWKIQRVGGAALKSVSTLEGLSTFEELEAVLTRAALPAVHAPREILTLTKAMECEGQGIYRHRAPGEEWTLLWIALR